MPVRPSGMIRRQGFKTLIGQWDHLYDSMGLPNGAFTGEKNFFTVPKGNTILGGTYSKELSDTNLTQSGMIPAGNVFEIFFLKGFILGNYSAAGVPISLIQLIQSRAVIELIVSNVVRLTMPIASLPVEFGMYIPVENQAVAAASIWPASNQINAAPSGFRLEKSIQIQPNEQFSIRMTFHDSVTIAGAAANTRMMVDMLGMLNKPAA